MGKNILHVVNIAFVIPYFLGEQLKHFSNLGYQEYIICSPSEELSDFEKKYHFKAEEIPINRKISILADICAVIKTIRNIRRNKIDIVTGHTPKGGLVAMIAAYIAMVPCRIYFRHGLVYETSKGFKRTLLITIDRIVSALATNVVCVSPSLLQKSVEDGLCERKKQSVLHCGTCNGIDSHKFDVNSLNKFCLNQIKKNLHIKETDFVIGFAGRLVRDKGIIELVRAFKIFFQKHPNSKLLLVGMYEERDSLPEHIKKEIEEDGNIIRAGYVKNDIIEYYYALMDVYVFPSYREGFGLSVLEASSMRKPVLVSKVTGCVDAILPGKTGLFVEHNGVDIAKKLELLYNNDALRNAMGERGRRFVVDNFNQIVVWQEIENLYNNDIIENHDSSVD